MTPAVKDKIAPSCEPVAPIFLRYRDNLLKYIQSKVQDPISREDLLSEVMIKLYDQCERLEKINNVEAWLISIARHTISDYFRTESRRTTLESTEEQTVDLELSEQMDITSCVGALLDLLPERYGTPLRMYELEGISQKELAKRYGLSDSGLKSRVQRGRAMLRDLFVTHCAEVTGEGCEATSCSGNSCAGD